MRRLLIIVTMIGLCAFPVLTTAPAGAVDVFQPCQTNGNPAVCKDRAASNDNPIYGPNGILTKIAQILAIVVGIGAVIGIVISGFMMVASGGDPGKSATARSALIYSVVGLAVAAFAQAIVSFVLSKLGA